MNEMNKISKINKIYVIFIMMDIAESRRPGFEKMLLTSMVVIAALHRKFGKACSEQTRI
jgi:hypothetical protein